MSGIKEDMMIIRIKTKKTPWIYSKTSFSLPLRLVPRHLPLSEAGRMPNGGGLLRSNIYDT